MNIIYRATTETYRFWLWWSCGVDLGPCELVLVTLSPPVCLIRLINILRLPIVPAGGPCSRLCSGVAIEGVSRMLWRSMRPSSRSCYRDDGKSPVQIGWVELGGGTASICQSLPSATHLVRRHRVDRRRINRITSSALEMVPLLNQNFDLGKTSYGRVHSNPGLSLSDRF